MKAVIGYGSYPSFSVLHFALRDGYSLGTKGLIV